MDRGIGRGRLGVLALGLLAVLGLVGCGSSSPTSPSSPPTGPSSPTGPSASTGSLTVTITAPAGVTPTVTVSGPGGYQQSLSATQTLSGLAPGSYTVTAASVTVANPIVAAVYDATVTGGPATVTAGATAAASVSYAARPGTGALWVVTLGDLFSSSRVVEFAASQLAASGSPTPAVTLSATGGSLNRPGLLAFDASGNLWVANGGNHTVVEFAASQLGASGSPTPTVTVSATSGSLNNPAGLAFDASGNLWVANAGTSNTVVEFVASQLAASGSPTPTVTVSTTIGSLTLPIGLAFDPTALPVRCRSIAVVGCRPRRGPVGALP